jgi:hypothetical protein
MVPTIPSSRKRAAGPAVWLALLALWLQALLPAIHHPGSMFMSGMSGSLCLAGGGAPAPPQDKAPNHKLPPCPICQSLQILAAGFVPPAKIAIPLPVIAGTVSLALSTAVFHVTRQVGAAQARGPPLSN